jgi:rhodanese-related sulfurtransferase
MTRAYGVRVGPAPAAFATLDQALAALPDARVLDVRDPETFARGHIDGAGRFTLAEFDPHRAELPSRDVPVLVVHDAPALAREAAEALASLGYARVGWLGRSLAEEPRGHASRAAAARLWSPSPFLEREVSRARPGRALDLACGSGRAAVFLGLAGFTAEGWDIDASGLERARALASRHGVDVRFEERDVERAPLPERDGTYALIVVVRFLHRPLFPWIERALAPGGVLLYETFRDGQQAFGPPRRERHLLRAGELLTAFPALVVEHHEETPDGVPPLLARLAARKPD